MKKILRCLLAAVFVMSLFAVCTFQSAAESTEYTDADGNVYTYTQTSSGVKINRIILKNFGTNLVIPDTINGTPVTALGNNLFGDYDAYTCSMVVGVTIPDTVKTLGVYTFNDCEKLQNVAFGNVTDITIYSGTFQSCFNLQSVTFGKTQNVTIAASAFARLTKLQKVDFGNPTGMVIKNSCFQKSGLREITVPKGVSLGQYVFSECPNLIKAEIYASPLKQTEKTTDPRTGKVISERDVFSEYLFYKCPVLRDVSITTYETIYPYMFSECPDLQTVNVGHATAIGNYAFANCPSLKNFTCNGKINIGRLSFENCSEMEYFDFSKVSKLDYASFANCSSLKNVNISNIGISEKCFSGCKSLTSLDLSGVTEIGSFAFAACTGLQELYFDHDIAVYDYAFQNCTGLKKIRIGDKVKCINLSYPSFESYRLAENIFEGCTNVEYIYIGAAFLPTVVTDNDIYLASDFFGFYHLDALETIEVSPNNPYYRSDNSVLYVDEGDVFILLCYPRAKKGAYYSTEKALADVHKDFTLGYLAFCRNRYIQEVNFTRPVVYPEFEENDTDLIYYGLLDRSFYDTSVEKVTFPKGGMKTIGYSMFADSAIRDIDLSDTQEIHSYAFAGCKNLTEANLLSCTDLRDYAFEDCTSLRTVNLPMWRIEYDPWHWSTDESEGVFSGCTALESVNMPLTEYIPEKFFSGCTSLVNVNAPKCEILGERCFFGCTALKKLDMTLNDIGKYALAGCSNLQSVMLKDAYIYEGAFTNCIALQNITGMQYIEKNAFAGCVSLKNLKLYGVRKIGDNAFKGCTSLYLAQFDNTKCTFGKNVFEGYTKLSFYCDENSDAYNYAVKNNIPVIAVSVGFQKDVYEYTGSKIEPGIIVSMGDMTLVQNTDYILTFEKNVNVGGATVTVHFIGDFEGLPDAYRVFTITRRSIQAAEVEYVEDYVYSGDDIKPAVVVKLDGKTLVEGVDYTIQYTSGADTGTMLFTIQGKGNYRDSIDCYYNIVRRDIAEATVCAIPDSVYTGEEICPVPTLTWNSFTLVYGEDFEVNWFDNVNAGFGTVVIYGLGNFSGTARVQFRIFGKDISSADVSAIADQTYTGQTIQPQVTITADGKVLTENVDYTVEYRNNTESGTASVIIRGIGNYSGVVEKSFTIYKNSVYAFTVFSETQMTATYDGTPLKPEMEVYFGTQLLREGVDYTVRLQNNVNAGTATVTICGIGLFEGERSYDFTILPCLFGAEDITVDGNTEYNGSAIEPQVTVYKNNKLLENGKEYTVTYSNNVEVGTAYLTVVGIGNYCGTVNLEFEIYAPADSGNVDKDTDKEQGGGKDPLPDDGQSESGQTPQKPQTSDTNSGSPGGNDAAQSGSKAPSAADANTQKDKQEPNAVPAPSIPKTGGDKEDADTVETVLWVCVTVPLLIVLNILDDKWRKKHGKKTFAQRIEDAANDCF